MALPKLLNTILKKSRRKQDHKVQINDKPVKDLAGVMSYKSADTSSYDISHNKRDKIHGSKLSSGKATEKPVFGGILDINCGSDGFDAAQHITKINIVDKVGKLPRAEYPRSACLLSTARHGRSLDTDLEYNPQSDVGKTLQNHTSSSQHLAIREDVQHSTSMPNTSLPECRTTTDTCAVNTGHVSHTDRSMRDRTLKLSVDLSQSAVASRHVARARSTYDSSRNRNRVKFSDKNYVSETYDFMVYDRTPITKLYDERQTTIEIYRELMRFKLTEMQIHERSLENTNIHLGRLEEYTYNVMLGELHKILVGCNN